MFKNVDIKYIFYPGLNDNLDNMIVFIHDVIIRINPISVTIVYNYKDEKLFKILLICWFIL